MIIIRKYWDDDNMLENDDLITKRDLKKFADHITHSQSKLAHKLATKKQLNDINKKLENVNKNILNVNRQNQHQFKQADKQLQRQFNQISKHIGSMLETKLAHHSHFF